MTMWDELRAQVGEHLGSQDAPWEPPGCDDFRCCKVMAFDPSLSATGWVHLLVHRLGRQHRIALLAKGTLRVRTGRSGYLGTYERATLVKTLVEEVIWRGHDGHEPSAIAWEAPAVRGHRLESSLIAGLMVYQACGGKGTVIQANHASALLTGSPAHDKGAIGAAVARYVPGAQSRVWNHNERDALAIALAYALDLDGD